MTEAIQLFNNEQV